MTQIWSVAIKLSNARAFQRVVVMVVAVVVAPFFMAIIITTRHMVRARDK